MIFVHCGLNKGLSYQSELHTSSTWFGLQNYPNPLLSISEWALLLLLFYFLQEQKYRPRFHVSSYLWHMWRKTKKPKTSLLNNPDASSASANKASSCLRTAEPWGRGIKKHVKSMRVFLFPDLVFPCSLILPLSGVSAQVSSLLIGQDWDGRNSWSALTHRPMIFFFFYCDCANREANVVVSELACRYRLRCLTLLTKIKR